MHANTSVGVSSRGGGLDNFPLVVEIKARAKISIGMLFLLTYKYALLCLMRMRFFLSASRLTKELSWGND